MLIEQTQKVLEAIGINEIIHPVFYHCPIGLRFEIGAGDVFIDRKGKRSGVRKEYVDTALTRAIHLYKSSIPEATILVWEVSPQSDQEERKLLDTFMKKTRFGEPDEKRRLAIEDNGEISKKLFAYWDLSKCRFAIETLFEEIITGDIGGFSQLTSSVFILDSNANMMFHLYDDWGADIAAAKKESLLPIYRKFNSWILNYDREQMDKIFGK